ncbi:integrase core domain-containing protein [Brevundimonas sp.]|uniref:integrase core domain-containing protein n=1 Tax=Brevundimonas sp. TaxID=1871086 RepID=UPI003DA8EAFD
MLPDQAPGRPLVPPDACRHAAEKLEGWCRCYNDDRPHTAIGNKTPITLLNSDDTASLTRAGKLQPRVLQKMGTDS